MGNDAEYGFFGFLNKRIYEQALADRDKLIERDIELNKENIYLHSQLEVLNYKLDNIENESKQFVGKNEQINNLNLFLIYQMSLLTKENNNLIRHNEALIDRNVILSTQCETLMKQIERTTNQLDNVNKIMSVMLSGFKENKEK